MSEESHFLVKQKFFNAGLALCIVTLPWNMWLNSICVLVFSTLILINAIVERDFKLDRNKFFLASFLFWIPVLWLFNTSYLDEGFTHIQHSLSLVAFPVAFSLIPYDYLRKSPAVYKWFLISCLLRFVVFLFQIVELELVLIPDYWIEVLSLFNQYFKEKVMHPSYFSMYLGVCSLYCLDQWVSAGTTKGRFLWAITLLGTILINMSLMAKMSFVASTLALLVFAVLKMRRKKPSKKYGIFGALILGVFIIFLWKIPNTFTQDFMNYYRIATGKQAEDVFDYNQYGGSSNIGTWEKTNRMYIWDSALKVVRENMVFGVGTGDVVGSLNAQYEKDGRSFMAIYDTNTHNQFLDYMVRYGLLGFVMILMVFVFYVKVAMTRKDPIYLSILLLFLLAMMTENVLDRQHGVVLFAYLNSIYFLARKESELLLLR